MRNFVVLVNERPEGLAALDWALHNVARVTGSADHQLHVVVGPSTDIPGGPRYVSPSLATALAAQLATSGVAHEIYTESRDPVARVIALAEELRSDLVVIGMQKRSATLKLFLGSHTRDILVDAPCPVVAVKE